MIISEDRFMELYRSISEPITTLRIDNNLIDGFSVDQMNIRLSELEQEIYCKVKSALNLQRSK